MDMELKEKHLSFVITTVCTLNCRHCSSLIPYFKKTGAAKHTSLKVIQREIAAVFQIYDHIEDVTISGGEPLLHPELTEIVSYCMSFAKQFTSLRIFTNGTIIPKQELLAQIKAYDGRLTLTVDDYGPERSARVGDIAALFAQNGLPLRIIHYWGDDQHCGGWVKLGPPEQYRGYSPTELETMYKSCHFAQYKVLSVLNGKLSNCGRAIFGRELGLMSSENALADDQIIDLLDTNIPLSRKKEIAAAYGTTPLQACRYCGGFNSGHGERIPAGEQL